MSLERAKLYQDQLYGTKVLDPLAVAVIDTPEFQRLAGLRQLGFADRVYRGATHTRFEHAVGSCFLSQTLLRRLAHNHERLGLPHPGRFLSPRFAGPADGTDEARWRGLTGITAIAALLHDVAHVPFGHTLEDEFAGLYGRHDRLASPRLRAMLFDPASDLARVFSHAVPPWFPGLTNTDLARLIFVILNWTEDATSGAGFPAVLAAARAVAPADRRPPLDDLARWHAAFAGERLFHPFMSDLIGTAISADLLDYLPRDRLNLGMEPRLHTRLHRYFTVRPGSLYADEGLRLSILACRRTGGQRLDVATAILAIMRERNEMAERVFYHHKKAALSTTLVKLLELTAPADRPRDDGEMYPAPWTIPIPAGEPAGGTPRPPHLTHLSDASLVEYLARAGTTSAADRPVRDALATALRFRRTDLHRTLLVLDAELAAASRAGRQGIVAHLRGAAEAPSQAGRQALETALAAAAGGHDGDVLVYCPSPEMQSRDIDVRLEIEPGRILPLGAQRPLFAHRADVDVLDQYYRELWRAYIFVSPALAADAGRCRAVVDAVCRQYGIPAADAWRRVRGHRFAATPEEGHA
ncbi:MAG TPA: hypothetical protein VND92_08290 [Vicinamibacterales bacterium]|nr:hypothetical protein [Vicinamibacterales bacterium]